MALSQEQQLAFAAWVDDLPGEAKALFEALKKLFPKATKVAELVKKWATEYPDNFSAFFTSIVAKYGATEEDVAAEVGRRLLEEAGTRLTLQGLGQVGARVVDTSAGEEIDALKAELMQCQKTISDIRANQRQNLSDQQRIEALIELIFATDGGRLAQNGNRLSDSGAQTMAERLLAAEKETGKRFTRANFAALLILANQLDDEPGVILSQEALTLALEAEG